MKILIAISGASGVNLGLKAYSLIPKNHQKYLIVSENSKLVSLKEQGYNIFNNNEIWEGPASGSFGIDAMMIIPCSMNTLAKIAVGISDNLITRAASVVIKEKKKLLIAPREIPFSSIALENMYKLSLLNVIIAPPILGYYSEQKNLDDMENFIIGKWFDLIGIEHSLYKRWGKNE
ncbi:UbiX family flavin prenyltransferase [Nitrosophilus kaiyonis]|uniref:UbiX family flavin prenyltransferase n=1 Tax=Nitrosophilus kaiyonis TaxID=2930200 RepID=UPI0024909067|nr:UbiX family flavin prenyltransferase [Nitrosophilus kaiyonis]